MWMNLLLISYPLRWHELSWLVNSQLNLTTNAEKKKKQQPEQTIHTSTTTTTCTSNPMTCSDHCSLYISLCVSPVTGAKQFTYTHINPLLGLQATGSSSSGWNIFNLTVTIPVTWKRENDWNNKCTSILQRESENNCNNNRISILQKMNKVFLTWRLDLPGRCLLFSHSSR